MIHKEDIISPFLALLCACMEGTLALRKALSLEVISCCKNSWDGAPDKYNGVSSEII